MNKLTEHQINVLKEGAAILKSLANNQKALEALNIDSSGEKITKLLTTASVINSLAHSQP